MGQHQLVNIIWTFAMDKVNRVIVLLVDQEWHCYTFYCSSINPSYSLSIITQLIIQSRETTKLKSFVRRVDSITQIDILRIIDSIASKQITIVFINVGTYIPSYILFTSFTPKSQRRRQMIPWVTTVRTVGNKASACLYTSTNIPT